MKMFGVDDLRAMNACEDQIVLFRETFGDSTELSRANLIKADKAGLDVPWLAKELLSKSDYRTFEERWILAENSCSYSLYRARKILRESGTFRSDDPDYQSAIRAQEDVVSEAIGNALADALGLD